MAYDWAKLWIEMLDDRKTASLPDSAWRRFVECILLAMETNRGGILPSVPDMAWRLRVTPETMGDDLTRLALSGLVELTENNEWLVTNFAKRQAAVPVNDRVASHRERAKKQQRAAESNEPVTPTPTECNEPVTERYTDKIRLEEKRGEETAREPQPQPAKAKTSPPPLVKTQSTDRTPGGRGYLPPQEPPPPKEPPRPAAEVVAVGELANAITEVTGVSARLNWSAKDRTGVGDLAEDLHRAGYTAEQIRAHYGPRKVAERWHWYESDWRGKKGDKPRLKEIRETIAGAVVDQPGKPQQESGQSWLEQSLRLARANGLLPQT